MRYKDNTILSKYYIKGNRVLAREGYRSDFITY